MRDWLDKGDATAPTVSIHSAAEALMIFLESLKEPIIPFSMYSRCLECSANYLQCKQIVSQLPSHHKHVFNYLTAFLREVLKHSHKNGIDPKILATLVCTVFLRVRFKELLCFVRMRNETFLVSRIHQALIWEWV